MAPKVCVAICAYTLDRWELLVAAAQSVMEQGVQPSELLVVSDYNDELGRQAASLPGVRVVANSGPKGLSGARNTALASTGADLVVFLDDDAVASPGWLEHLIEPFDDPSVMAAGGPARAIWAERRPDWFPAEFDWVIGCTYRGHATQAGEIRNPIGCNMALRRDLAVAVGGFTDGIGRLEALPLGCEETELCIRLRQRHPEGRVLFVPGAEVHQIVTPERSRLGYFHRRCFAEGISKALVSERVGAGDALASERAHVARALPAGVLERIRLAASGRPRTLGQGATIVTGTACAVAGYARGLVTRRRHPSLGRADDPENEATSECAAPSPPE